MTSAQATVKTVICDGCGQGTGSEHIAKRLWRLEQTTRYRPIHIQVVFLSVQSPADANSFLYGAEQGFQGEAAQLLNAVHIETAGRTSETVLTEFQRKGFLLTHVLECAAGNGANEFDLVGAMKKRLPNVLRRLRASLRPKRVIVISKDMAPVVAELKSAQIVAELLLDGDAPFDLTDAGSVRRLSSALQSM
jgi:hypothetical protein